MATNPYTETNMTAYTDGYAAGARLVLDIIKRAAALHPRQSGKQTLTSLHTVLEEGLQQWLTDQETEAANSTSPNSSTPQ